MARTPRIALDTDTAHTLDGRQLRSLTFQSVRMEYVARTLEATGPHPEGARALTVGAGRGLVCPGRAPQGRGDGARGRPGKAEAVILG
jgi:2-polyprenyl-6-hydroxyphenyl methylase/3-demethylubiquinone-9 3-methyltransferase